MGTEEVKCAYCGARGVNADHVIPKQALRRFQRRELARGRRRTITYFTARGTVVPPEFLTTVPACFNCNIAKGSRLLIPSSWSHRLDELNELGIGVFRVWDGKVDLLRTTV